MRPRNSAEPGAIVMPDRRTARKICLATSLLAVGLTCTLEAGAFAADAITVDDLAGAVVEANINRHQKMERDGRMFTIQTHANWKFGINRDKTIDLTLNTTLETPRGTRKAPPNAGHFSLDEPREVSSRGGGQGVWNFADGALHFTRTFPSGAYRAHFTFARTDGGLSCEVTEGFFREDGKKPITLASPLDGAQVSIIDSKQDRSDCKIKAAKSQ